MSELSKGVARVVYLLLALIVVVSCSPPARGPGADVGDRDYGYEVNYDGVGFLDIPLDNVAVESASSTPGATGLLMASAAIRNRGDYDYVLSYRVRFFDDAYGSVDATSWKTVRLPRNGIQRLEGSTSSTRSMHFYFELKEGN